MSLRLWYKPGEWDGTFAVAARALVADLLLDGDVPVLINNEVRLRTLTGYDPAGDRLIFEGNETVPLTEVSEIEVP